MQTKTNIKNLLCRETSFRTLIIEVLTAQRVGNSPRNEKQQKLSLYTVKSHFKALRLHNFIRDFG